MKSLNLRQSAIRTSAEEIAILEDRSMGKTPKTFITYSHNDKKEKEELKTRLAVMENNGEIELWDDNEILPR